MGERGNDRFRPKPNSTVAWIRGPRSSLSQARSKSSIQDFEICGGIYSGAFAFGLAGVREFGYRSRELLRRLPNSWKRGSVSAVGRLCTSIAHDILFAGASVGSARASRPVEEGSESLAQERGCSVHDRRPPSHAPAQRVIAQRFRVLALSDRTGMFVLTVAMEVMRAQYARAEPSAHDPSGSRP
jgi:hypothetical protein